MLLYFYEKAKIENTIQGFVLHMLLIGSAHTQSGTTKLLSQNYLRLSSQFQAVIALKYVCELLCFISIYFMHLLAGCVLSYQKSPKGYFLGLGALKKISVQTNGNCFFALCHLAYKRHRNALLLDSRDNLYFLVFITISHGSARLQMPEYQEYRK